MSMAPKRALVGAAVEHVGRRAGSSPRRCRTPACRRAMRSAMRVEQPRRLQQHATSSWTRRPGMHERVDRARSARSCAPRRVGAELSQDVAWARERALQRQHAHLRPGGLRTLTAPPAYQPRSASLTSSSSDLRGRSSARRGPRLTLARMSGSRKWVVASTMALARGGRVLALEDARPDEHRLGARAASRATRRPAWRCRRRRTAAPAASRSRRSPARAAAAPAAAWPSRTARPSRPA